MTQAPPTREELAAEIVKARLEAWKMTIDVQKHFNDLELRIRGMAITVLTAVIAAAGVTSVTNVVVNLFGWVVPLAALVLLAGLVGWFAFFLMDAVWYHPLLMGSVQHARKIEEWLVEPGEGVAGTASSTVGPPAKGAGAKDPSHSFALTTAISEASVWKGIHSRTKMILFYGLIALLIIGLMVASCFGSSVPGGSTGT